MTKSCDYIVIGSGFGGSVAALRLAEKGYSVLVLEKGKVYESKDFPKTNWNLRKYLWLPALRFFGFQKLSFYREASILSGVGVGGGSLVYANTLFYPPSEFFRHSSWSRFGDWQKKLDPHYVTAGKMMGRVAYDKLNREDLLLHEVAEDMGKGSSFETVYVGVYFGDREVETDPYFDGAGPLRRGCTECAGCMVGCKENAKNSLDKNYLYFARKQGAVILPERKVEKIEYIDDSYIVHSRSSTSFINRNLEPLSCRGIIIAGGTLGSMELLLKQKYHYKSLPELSDCTGWEIRTNSETLCAVSGLKEKMNNGVAISSVFNPDPNTHIEVVKYPDGSNALKWFFSLSVPGAGSNLARTIRFAGRIFINPLKFLKMLFNGKWSTGLVIFLVMQHLDNSMKMLWVKNLLGGRMRIINTGDKKVPAYIDIGQQVMEKYAEKSGGLAQNIILEILFNRSTTAHILGGCPMSESRESGVINPDFQVHGYPNMYVVDGSAIQGNIGVNPSLSILAIAEYAMSKIQPANSEYMN